MSSGFDFPPNVPAPFNMAAAILTNTEMLTLEKVRMVPGLLPMLTEGQSFIDAQDGLSVLEFMRTACPSASTTRSLLRWRALDFIDPDKLSMTVVLTAMNRFINEADGRKPPSSTATSRIGCARRWAHIEARGGEVRTGQPLSAFEVDPTTGEVRVWARFGEVLRGYDYYVSAMPIDVLKRLVPAEWSAMPYFRQFDELEGIPVINVHIWFDRKLDSVDALCFSRSPLLSVYADMSTTCKEYASETESMLGSCSRRARRWRAATRTGSRRRTRRSSTRRWASSRGSSRRSRTTRGGRRRRRRPRGPGAAEEVCGRQGAAPVYAAIPGRNKFRPSQETPIPNMVLAGDWTSRSSSARWRARSSAASSPRSHRRQANATRPAAQGDPAERRRRAERDAAGPLACAVYPTPSVGVSKHRRVRSTLDADRLSGARARGARGPSQHGRYTYML